MYYLMIWAEIQICIYRTESVIKATSLQHLILAILFSLIEKEKNKIRKRKVVTVQAKEGKEV